MKSYCLENLSDALRTPLILMAVYTEMMLLLKMYVENCPENHNRMTLTPFFNGTFLLCKGQSTTIKCLNFNHSHPLHNNNMAMNE